MDGLARDCSNSIAKAMELLQSCTKPSTYMILNKKSESLPWEMWQHNGTKYEFLWWSLKAQ